MNTAAVTSEADPTVAAQPHQPDLFYRLFGDVQGTGRVNAPDYNAFLSTYSKGSGDIGFIPCLDFNADGVVDSERCDAILDVRPNARCRTERPMRRCGAWVKKWIVRGGSRVARVQPGWGKAALGRGSRGLMTSWAAGLRAIGCI